MIVVMGERRTERAGQERDPVRSLPGAFDFDRLFTEVAPPLYRALYAYTGRRAAVAEDATAEAFARAVAYQDGIRDPRAWLYRTAFRIAAAELREDRRRHAAVPDVAVDPPELVGLADALQQLAPQQRAAIALRYVSDLSTRETAATMGIGVATVRVHLFRARAHLRELLRDEEA